MDDPRAWQMREDPLIEAGPRHAAALALGPVHNLDGISATVPHKFSAYRRANTASDRAHRLTAANILRRNADGSWHGDMLDGVAMVGSIRNAGCEPAGRRALPVGAGGAGSAIASSLLDAGVTELAVNDSDIERRDALLERLRKHHGARIVVGSADPMGFTLVVNATPAGMKPDDPLPIMADRLTPQTFVADVGRDTAARGGEAHRVSYAYRRRDVRRRTRPDG